jgi:tripartite-type tricarboxylate transporter receptor subunit TctC
MGTLSADKIAQWKHDGFLSPFPLLDEEELQACRQGVERYEAWLGSPINAHPDMRWRSMPYLLLPWAARLARDPRILDKVEDLLGPDILIFTSTFFIKEPHSATIAAWHQDSTYYGLEPKDEVTVWIALTEASEAAGCMDALSFQGRPRQHSHLSRVVKDSVNRAGQVITEPLDDSVPVAMPLKPGWFSMHHGLCPHRSGPNTLSHRRIGLGLNYIPTCTRPSGSVRQAALLVRGTDRFGPSGAGLRPAIGIAWGGNVIMKIGKWITAGLLFLCCTVSALAQDYPNRPVTMVVPFAAAGPGDIIARLVAEAMRRSLGQEVIVVNVGGAGGTIGTARVAQAKPDGYTILLGHVGQATSVSLYKSLTYDPIEGFETIGLITDVPMTIVGKPDLAPKDLKSLVAYIRENPDRINYAHSGLGSVAHLCGLMFMSATGTKMAFIPYKGGGEVTKDLLAGRIDVYCEPATGTTANIQAGKIKPYAVTTKRRVATLPDVPTTTEAGFPEIGITTWYGLYAPKGTPAAAIDKLATALQAALKDSNVVTRFAQLSMEPVPQDQATPAALDAKLRSEVKYWSALLKEAGVQPE